MEITIQNVSKKIHKNVILPCVNLQWRSRNIYGLQGPNGPGKTMLIRIIAGLIRPSSGHIWIGRYQLGEDIEFPSSMGLLLKKTAFLPEYTGFKNLELLASIKGQTSAEAIQAALLDVGIDPKATQKYKKYSLDMKQRLGIAAAIFERPDLILLDEPTNALDEEGIEQICALIRRERDRGALVVIASHDDGFTEAVADRVYWVTEEWVKDKTEVLPE